MSLTSVTGKSEVRAKEWGKEVILSKKEPAPFMGVLVPEYNFREYQKAIDENTIRRLARDSQALACEKELSDECGDWDTSSLLMSMGLSLILGVVVGVYVARD